MNQPKMQNVGGFAGSGPGQVQQNNLDVQNGSIINYIVQTLQQQQPGMGWRAQVGIQERMYYVKQVVDSLRLLKQPHNDIPRMANIALTFEQKAFTEANDKETYVHECQKKLGKIRDSRVQQVNAQASQNIGQNAFQQAQQFQQMGQNLPFPPQLQHQMQASPIPQPQGQQLGMNVSPAMNMQAGGGGPGARGMQQPKNFMQSQQPRPNPQAGPLKMTPEDNDAINRLAQQFAMTTSDDDKRKIQQNLQNIPPEQLQTMRNRGVDPMTVYFRDRAIKQWKFQQSAMNGNPNFAPNMQMNPALAQRQGQPPTNMTGPQGGRGMPGTGQSVGAPFLNVDHIQGMQEQGRRSQEQGQLVVPASNGQGINPEQFRLQQFVNNQQRAKQNPTARVNPQFMSQQPQPQPGLSQPDQGLQQPHQEKTNNTAGLQAQSQVRAPTDAAAIAQQQVGMQNQHGLQGMSQSGTPLSMLTRPVGTNVQGPAPSQSHGTPQPRPPSRAPNSAQQPTPQMQQNFLQGGQQNNSQQPGLQPQTLAGLPQPLQVLLSKYPRDQWGHVIARSRAVRQQPRFSSGAPPMSQTLSQPGENQPTANGQHLGNGIPMQHSASAGAPGTQGHGQGMSPNPSMMAQQQPPQPPQQQQRRQPDPNHPHVPQMPNQQAPTSMPLQGTSLPDLSPENIAYMDDQPIPQQVIQNVVQRYGLPSQIKTWSNLKQYLAQTSDTGLPVDKILSVQKLQFHQMRQYMRGQNRPIADQSRPVSVQPGGGPQPAPQMRPNQQDQSQINAPQQNQLPMKLVGNLPPVTAEEIQRVRMSNPQYAQMPDAHIRAYITAVRQNEARKRLALTQQAQNNQQMAFMPGQTLAQPPQLGMGRQQPHQAGIAPGNTAVQTTQMRAGMQGPRPQPMSATRPASQAAPQPQVAGTSLQPAKGIKRANEDEVMETSNPNLAKNSALPQQAGSAQPFRMLSREELARMPPEEQKAYRERQNHHQQHMLFTHIAKLTDDVRRTSPPLHPIPMDVASRARIVKVLTAPGTKQMLARFNALLLQYFLMTRNHEDVKQLVSYRLHLLSQYSPASIKANTWEPAEQFSITADYAEAAIKDVIAHFNHILNSRAPPQQPIGSAPPPPPAEASGSHPLSADNLKRHQDMQAAERAKRPAQEVPPAPTASQPPLTFTDVSPRGQGTPCYAPAALKQGLKQEDLKFPSKRQKKNHQDNAVSTPVGAHVSPAVSPQMRKGKKQDELPFKCAVVECEYHDKGFATKGDLDNHSNTVHKPVEEHIADPLGFFLDSMRNGFGLDENGEPKAKPTMQALKAPEMQKTASKGVGLASKPVTPAPASAAMARGISQMSGPKAGSPSTSQLAEAKSGPAKGAIGGAPTDNSAWDTSNISLSDLQNTFGDLASKAPQHSLTQHDPLSANNDIADFMDQFMESDAWTKMQETAVNVETASSKATESPAQLSDRGQGNSDISKGDELFIKIGAEDTELAESWALPELRIEPEASGQNLDEADEWMKMDFGDVSIDDVENVDDMDFEWKEVDWDKLLAEQDGATAVSGKK